MPYLQYEQDSLRARALRRHSMLWCLSSGSGHVTSAEVNKIGATNLRALEGWKKLASSDGCTTCHAHLDYGAQFFKSYASSWVGVTNAAPPFPRGDERGPMYGLNIKDLRGEAALTPAGFAELALRDQRFAACMTKRVADYLAPEGLPQAQLQEMEHRFTERYSFKDLVKAGVEVALQKPTPTVARPPSLASVGERCAACHTDGPFAFFSGGKLSKVAVPAMIDAIAEGRMPPGPDLQREEQRQLVATLIDYGFDDQAQRDKARAFYLQRTVYLLDGLGTKAVIDNKRVCSPRKSQVTPAMTSGVLTTLDALKLATMIQSAEGGADCQLSSGDWDLLLHQP